MGLLDDAIREHLELKRQRGADDAEVARLEREALGPVVRGNELAADVEPADAASFSPEYHDDAAAPTEYLQPPPEQPLTEPPAEPPLEPDQYTPPAEAPLEPDHYTPPAHAGQPTEEFDVESAHAHEAAHPPPPAPPEPEPHPAAPEPSEPPPGEPGEHDVLEETPEFLQETPEHDRLWFEQAPPQEFDFDK